MTRDLPFDDDDAEATEPSGDTAYRVATGVARVARAGAYVTGGALIASNGGGNPDHPGGQRLDSWHTGWSGNNDPDSDVPSPVVTFPDPEPNYVPLAPQRPAAVAHKDTFHAVQLPDAPNDDVPVGIRVGTPPEDTGTGFGTDDVPGAPSFLDHAPSAYSASTQQWSGTPGAQQPDWLTGNESEQARVESSNASGHGFGPGFDLPDGASFLSPGSNPFFPRPAAGEANDGELAELADENASRVGFGQSGFGNSGFGHSGVGQVDSADAAELFDSFNGIGDGDGFGVYLGVDASFELQTELGIDFGIGPNGAYLTTEMKVEASAELSIKTAAGSNVGDQLDSLSDWLDGKNSSSGTGRSTTDQSGTGTGATGLVGGSGAAPGAVAPQPAPAAVAAAPAPIAVSSAPAPIAVAPQPAPAPVAAAAPAAVAAPVVATPLQTTIQPEAATSPIANVLAAPTGPSPLTAPAAAVPVLFEQPVKPIPTTPVIATPIDTGTSPGVPTPVTKIPTTITNTIPTPTLPGQTTPDAGTGTIPGSVIPKTPGVDIKPKPDIDIDITGTKLPGASVTTQPTRPAPQPATPDNDVTTPGTIGGGASTGAGTSHQAPPTRPTVDAPTVEVPTVSVPVQPSITHSVPTVDIDVPTVDVPTVEVPTPAHTAPNPAPMTPMKPPIVGPNGRPISDQLDPSHGLATHPAAAHVVPDADHSVLAFTGGSLSTGLMPDAGMPGADPSHGITDFHLL
ncbi:hypothetical protein [Nocardia sp. NPDC050710]|uniref:hypothetical protein n=1 Tax=Nocardia sp. NPDC050710 TaxID=3157220 RepID=UPI00340EE538